MRLTKEKRQEINVWYGICFRGTVDSAIRSLFDNGSHVNEYVNTSCRALWRSSGDVFVTSETPNSGSRTTIAMWQSGIGTYLLQ
jgi:hypothetical protein